MKLKDIVGLAVTALIISVSVWLLANQQAVSDWWRLRAYKPEVDVAALANDSGMSDEGRRLFYIQDPQLLDRQDFTGKCDIDEETIVLGCYIQNDKIYIFDVNEDRLAGIEEVTAAHEMLHAVYDRLDEDERLVLDKLLIDTYKSLNNLRISKTVASYEARDPSIVNNELHSILGTEVNNLPAELENHYKQYFTNRAKVVALAEEYANEFTSLEDRIAGFDVQIEALDSKIKSEQANIEQLGQALNTEKQQLESLRSRPEEFNTALPSYNLKVREYNNLLKLLREDINQYNQLVEQRNSIALEEQELIQAINSNYTELE